MNGTVSERARLDTTLYLVTDSSYHTEESFFRTVEAALQGGVTLLQLREKDKSAREYMELAGRVKKIADRYGVPLLIDDRVDVAAAVDAAGVHVGQSDIPVAAARKILGPDKIVGATAKTTKVKTILTKVSTLKEICETVPIPVNAIGGLNAGNVDVLDGAGIAGICVVSAIMKAEDPRETAEVLKKLAEKLKG